MKKKLPPIKRQRGPHDGAGNNIISKLKCLELIFMLIVADVKYSGIGERSPCAIYLSTYTAIASKGKQGENECMKN